MKPKPYTEFELRVARQTIYSIETVRYVFEILKDEKATEDALRACSSAGLNPAAVVEDAVRLAKQLREGQT